MSAALTDRHINEPGYETDVGAAVHHRGMLATDIGTAIETARTFASPRHAANFTAAMQRIAAARRPGAPVRVYLSAPIEVTSDVPKWEQRTAEVRRQLPDGVELLAYADAVAQGLEFPRDWETFAETLDGLVLLPRRKGGHRPYVYRIGPQARNELRSLVGTRPTFLHAYERGLIPVIDCYSRRRGARQDRLQITVPKRWDRNAATLRAALGALTPRHPKVTGEERADDRLHLAAPFAQPG